MGISLVLPGSERGRLGTGQMTAPGLNARFYWTIRRVCRWTVSCRSTAANLFVMIRGAVIKQAMYGNFDVDDLIAGLHGIVGLMAWDELTS
jgi:hypothetical protein